VIITPLLSLTLASLFALSYIDTPPDKLIVGLWKHHKDDALFGFFKNGGICFKISFAQGAYEISGKFQLMDRNLLKIKLDHQYGFISGESLFKTPQILKVTIREDRIIFYDLIINDLEEQVFNRIK
jgi:hypothetical protein